MKCPKCKGIECADCGRVVCAHTGKNWGGLSFWHETATRLCKTCCVKRAKVRIAKIMAKKGN